MFVLGVILLTVIGIIMVANPYFIYRLIEEWKNLGGKPTKAYIFNIRFGGIVFIIVGIGCGLIGFIAT